MDGRGRTIAVRIEGNTAGLKPAENKALTRLAGRKFPVVNGYSSEQAHELAALSRLLSRQIGLVLDRQGHVFMLIVGDASSIYIPELPHARTGAGRLRGLRLLHTHLSPEGLSKEDLTDLLFLRLDSATVLTVDEWGRPMRCQSAHLMPPSSKESKYFIGELVPWDKFELDFSEQIEALEDEFSRTAVDSVQNASANENKIRAVLVSVSLESKAVQDIRLDELEELAKTAGISIAGRMVQRVAAIHPRNILKQTKLAELEVMALHGQASHIIFDGELSPAQMGSLDNLTERRVMDRTQLILEIFAEHAVTKAGKLQVELAQLQYQLPRLAGKFRSMDRLKGGIFGNKGRGETKLELERRQIRERITRIRHDLEELRKRRFHTRSRRARQGLPVAALVGYTNAGKSTLLNALTKAEVLTENKLFATLDTTTRRLRFPKERELVLADTVGFIRDLPEELTEAFRATLEELESADILIHVVNTPHTERDDQIQSVKTILADMELDTIPMLTVFNKWDCLKSEEQAALRLDHPDAIPVSALTGEGLDKFSKILEQKLFDEVKKRREQPQTWEEYQRKQKDLQKRKKQEKSLDSEDAFL